MNKLIIAVVFLLKFTVLAVLAAGFCVLVIMLMCFSFAITQDSIVFEIERMQKLLKTIIEL